MHTYSTDSEERARILLGIAAIAFGLAWLIAALLGGTHIPFWLDVPATGTLYGVLYKLFQRWGWRQRFIRAYHIVSVPDLRGEWRGVVRSSFDKYSEKTVVVQIAQNWTHMSITLASEASESRSTTGSIETGNEVIVSYQYQNTPKAHAKDTMHAHRGTATLKLSPDEMTLSGEYYSGRDRANFGAIELKRPEPVIT
jgi:hypothetical protein